MEWPFGFLKPEVEYRIRSYTLRDDDSGYLSHPNAPEESITISSPRYSLDAGLYFDREFEWLNSEYTQTLEPRLYWVNSPLVEGQNDIPNFDSGRSEEHTSELQSRPHLVCRLLLEKKKTRK